MKRNEVGRVDLSKPLNRQAEAAAKLGFTERTLEKWRLEGRGPEYIKIGRSVRYTDGALEAFIANAKVRRSTSEAA